MLAVLGWLASGFSLLGAVYTLFAARQVGRRLNRRPTPRTGDRPTAAVTILKPLHGEEPELYDNLQTFCRQDYAGPVQLLFGVHDKTDPAVKVVRDLQLAHPHLDIALIVDARVYGENRKVSNLINMERAIKGEVVVLSDSDIRVGEGYLAEVVGRLSDPAVGFVTCLYTGRSTKSAWATLAAMGINYQFLPNVLAGVRLGLATPCLGATVALRTAVLREIGGFSFLANQLADDYDLGKAVRRAGYEGVIAAPVEHLCAERGWAELWRHETRWMCTIRAIDPLGFLGAAVTYALPWALIGAALAPGLPALAILAAVLACRFYLAHKVDRSTGVATRGMHLFLFRDILSFAVFLNAFLGKTVSWRGRRFRIGSDGALVPAQEVASHAHAFSSGAVLRRLRRRGGIALPGEARDQIVLVSDLARATGGHGREQPADRRPAA